MTNQNTEKLIELPYGAEIDMMNNIIDIIGRNGTIEVGKLYELIPTTHKPTKSYSKKMADFFGLIQSEGQTLSLTKRGSLYRASNNEKEKKVFLAQNLPEKYVTMLNWINNTPEGSMTLGEMTKTIIRSWGDKPNKSYFSWVINTFATFCSWIGVINYIKGQNSRYVITDAGKAALEVVPAKKAIENLSEASVKVSEKLTHQVDQMYLQGSSFPIKIIARDVTPLELDVHYEEDWGVIDSYIKSLKRRWNNNASKK